MTNTYEDPTIPVLRMDWSEVYSDMPEFRPEDPDSQMTIATALGIGGKFHVVVEGGLAGAPVGTDTTISVVVTSDGPVSAARCIRRYIVTNVKYYNLVSGIACRWMLETALAEVAMESLF